MKKIMTLFLVLTLSLFTLTGCSSIFGYTTEEGYKETRKNGNNAVDMNSIVDAIYKSVYEKAEAEIYNRLLDDLRSEFTDGTASWDTLQEEIYLLVNGKAKATIGVTNYAKDPNTGEEVAEGTGSGVIYDKEVLTGETYKYRYYTITNEHVVDGGTKFTLDFSDGTSIDGSLIGKDKTTDIALLSFDTDREFEVATLGDSDNLKLGQIVIAVGNPKGYTLFGTTTFGIIGGKDRNLIDNGVVNSINKYIQHDASINPGNSGGGLYNLNGEIVGINSVKYVASDIDGLNFAIPSNLVKEVLKDLREFGFYKGSVSLGVTVTSVSSLNSIGRIQYKVPTGVTQGVVIISVSETGSANGILMPNDILYKIDEIAIVNTSDLSAVLDTKKIGDTVTISVLREGKVTVLNLTFKR